MAIIQIMAVIICFVSVVGCAGLLALDRELGGKSCTHVPPDKKVCVFKSK